MLEKLKGQLIVSCQALEDEPLHGSEIMARMALAAKEGGAAAIRANGFEDIKEIKQTINLPVIGIVKRNYHDSEIYISPTLKEVDEVHSAGAEILALDLTNRDRPGGLSNEEMILMIKEKFPALLIMADVSTYEEGIAAADLGLDLIGTTLAGYTSYSKKFDHPDFELISNLSQELSVPIIAEGRINTPEEAARCLELGAWAVVVGSAITRPQLIAKRFSKRLGIRG